MPYPPNNTADMSHDTSYSLSLSLSLSLYSHPPRVNGRVSPMHHGVVVRVWLPQVVYFGVILRDPVDEHLCVFKGRGRAGGGE